MRVALATVGTTGDIAPFAILAQALVARRHDVTAITWPVHRTAFADSGARVVEAAPAAAADHEMHAAARRLGERIGEEDGVTIAVGLIEEIT